MLNFLLCGTCSIPIFRFVDVLNNMYAFSVIINPFVINHEVDVSVVTNTNYIRYSLTLFFSEIRK